MPSKKVVTQTLTQISTGTVTGTQMAVATLALALSSAFALVSVPTQLSTASVDCGVESLTAKGMCPNDTFRRAQVRCQDGFTAIVGSIAVCSSLADLDTAAEQLCQKQCAPSPVSSPDPSPAVTAPTSAVTPTTPPPLLRVKKSSDTPQPTNFVFGALDQTLGKFTVTATGGEGIILTDIGVNFNIINGSTSTVRNIRLYQGSKLLATTKSLRELTPAYGEASFPGLGLALQKDEVSEVVVKADITPYESLKDKISGAVFQPLLLPGSIQAKRVIADEVVPASSIEFVESTGVLPVREIGNTTQGVIEIPSAIGMNAFVVYRNKISALFHGDTPKGLSSPGARQIIGKVVVINSANDGNYSAAVQSLNFNVESSMALTEKRDLKIYKDSITNYAHITTQFLPGKGFGYTRVPDDDFVDIDIAAGTQKDFLITLDTINAQAGNSLSLQLPFSLNTSSTAGVYGVVWSDGVIKNIIAHDNLLPSLMQKLSY